MRLRLLSDLHLEFHKDGGRAFAESLDPAGVDVLVLAGDVVVGPGIPRSVGYLCNRFADATVLYVHGNHEFYGFERSEVCRYTEQAVAENANLVWLDNSAVALDGLRFIGGPLWFRNDPSPRRFGMSDFHLIRGFESWVYEENASFVRLLENKLAPGDVVISHHLPCRASIDPRYARSPLNPWFLCDVEPLILERKPALWLHGHTHASVDTIVGDTRVFCNPFGYLANEENPGWQAACDVELTPRAVAAE